MLPGGERRRRDRRLCTGLDGGERGRNKKYARMGRRRWASYGGTAVGLGHRNEDNERQENAYWWVIIAPRLLVKVQFSRRERGYIQILRNREEERRCRGGYTRKGERTG